MSASYHDGPFEDARSPTPPRPRALLVDVGFTLTFWDGARIAAHAALEGVTVEPAAVERAEHVIRRETREHEGKPIRTHDDGGDGYLQRTFRHMLDVAGATGDAAAHARAAATIQRKHLERNVWRRIGAGNREALERLRDAGLRLAVVSNSEGTVEAMLEEVGLRPFFETVVDSAVVGSVKPDALIFQIALARLGLQPADALMVGDSPTADIHGAHALGLRAALVDPLDLYPWIKAPRFKDLLAFTENLLSAPI
jgi:HAD superfamily hydrolase (TIGR01549 family)